MKLVTGTTLDSRTALREYIHVSLRFLEFLQTGEKKAVLDDKVTSPAGPLADDAEKRGRVEGMYGAKWEIHVVPN